MSETEVKENEENKVSEKVAVEETLVEAIVETPVETPVEAPVAEEVAEVSQKEEGKEHNGVKEIAHNEDVMAEAQDSEETEDDGIAALPNFFIEDDDVCKVEVDVLTDKEGKIVAVGRTSVGLGEEEFPSLRYTHQWFDFKVPNYEAMSNYRKACSIQSKDGQIVIDRYKMRDFLLVWHLKDWSLTNPKGEKVKLKHDKEGRLNDASTEMVYKVPPALLDVVLTIFEKDQVLI